MKLVVVLLLLVVAVALFLIAGFMGAVPMAARLNNFGLAALAGAALVEAAPV